MASLFGEDFGLEDLLNGNLEEKDELPSDDENQHDKNIFDEDGDINDENSTGAKPIKVEPKKRAVRNPRPRLTVEKLQGRRGIHTIEEYFKDIKFKGKNHEKEDLNEIMRRLQHWGHRMYPTYKFDDVLNNIERLSKKKELQVYMSRYRLGLLQPIDADAEIINDNDDFNNDNYVNNQPFDEFDALLDEQIAISKLAPRTPANNSRFDVSATHTTMSNALATPFFNRGVAIASTQYTDMHYNLNDNDLAQPLPPSPPKTQTTADSLTEEEIERIAENRRIAKERLLATRMRQQQQQQQ